MEEQLLPGLQSSKLSTALKALKEIHFLKKYKFTEEKKGITTATDFQPPPLPSSDIPFPLLVTFLLSLTAPLFPKQSLHPIHSVDTVQI